MNKEEFIDMSKRMVMEYYNRYVHNIDPDLENIKINVNNVKIIEYEYNSDSVMNLICMVDIDVWLEYHIEYNQNTKDKINSYIILS